MQEASEGQQPLTLSEETTGGFGSEEVGQCDRSFASTGPLSSPRLRARSKGTVCLCYLPSLPHTPPSTLQTLFCVFSSLWWTDSEPLLHLLWHGPCLQAEGVAVIRLLSSFSFSKGSHSCVGCCTISSESSMVDCPTGTPYPFPVCVCVYVCVLVAQLCLTLCDPVDYSLPGSSVHGISQARILEWVAVPSSRGSS